ncbi:hypothetical protein BaOVIS_029030 [Babesia ovis]|uniref:Uncharacterized protein n=1 Tax=Babesia ovis TaxID=5869 RepID=A0A9W5WW31_BABOV|nr:hypothetical protein BaOVIS_029030 [Babesia ovis]
MEIDAAFERITGIPARRTDQATDGHECFTPTDNRTEGPRSTPKGRKSRYDFEPTRDEFERLGNFESMSWKNGGRFQDLTHQERQELQHFQAQTRLADPVGLLNKHRAKADPKRDAKALLAQMRKDERVSNGTEDGDDDPRAAAMVGENRFDEIVSRIRAQMRAEKQESSKINKAKIPNFNGVIVDPIAKHVQRRRLRINAMIKDHLEQIITANDFCLILGDLKGASVSLKRVEMASGKSTIKCYYTVIGADGQEEYVHQMLQQAQKKVRFCLARKLELGYTPPVLFIRANDADIARVKARASAPEHGFNRSLETTVKSLAERFHKTMVAF